MNAHRKLWQPGPERQRQTQLWRFALATAPLHGAAPDDYAALHAWSVREPAVFWNAVWDGAGILGDKGEILLRDGAAMPGAQFFPDARLNYAENLLRWTGPQAALVAHNEAGETQRWSRDELRDTVARLQQVLLAAGVRPGDRVAGFLPNIPEAIAAMLAAASIGAVWSSCSPDFGVPGVLDRFSQIAPVVFIAVAGYSYNGKRFDVSDTVAAAAAALEPRLTIVVGEDAAALAKRIAGGIALKEALERAPVRPLEFTQLPFSHPLLVLFSSGTTGKPKCIVHSAGGTLLQHGKEHRLHCDIRAGDRVFYYTTLSWMMWNWLVSALAAGATLCLYDGAPSYPSAAHLFEFAAAEQITHFGTSARYLDSLRKSGFEPNACHDLGALRAVFSTGSPLAADCFDFVYNAIGADLHLASISGGTDIVSCFVLGVPTLPVYAGEIQGPGLGMAIDVFDPDGRPLEHGKGELVCKAPFPSMPLGFWGDEGGENYRAAYFERFPGVWAHGDFAEWTDHGGLIIHGRSDATLNPGGVRIGTAEIYGIVENFPEIESALCVSQDWDGDTRIVLFVRLSGAARLDDELRDRLRTAIRKDATPRHLPARIIAVADLPRTRSGKLTELAVREVIHGRPVKNADGLANPEALRLFENLPELKS